MPQSPEFTSSEISEARRLNAKLNWVPRFRMETALGRVILQGFLWTLELYPLARGLWKRTRRELRTVEALGRSVKVRIFGTEGKNRGVVLDIHGGGWTIGNARMVDAENAELAERLGVAL